MATGLQRFASCDRLPLLAVTLGGGKPNFAHRFTIGHLINKKMKEPVIVQSNIKSKVRLEEMFDFTANVTIGLADGGDFYVMLDFIGLIMEDLKALAHLSKLSRRLSIKADIIDKEKYNISHIILTNISANSNLAMTWECLSDDPGLYDGLIIK